MSTFIEKGGQRSCQQISLLKGGKCSIAKMAGLQENDVKQTRKPKKRSIRTTGRSEYQGGHGKFNLSLRGKKERGGGDVLSSTGEAHGELKNVSGWGGNPRKEKDFNGCRFLLRDSHKQGGKGRVRILRGGST